MIRVLFVLGSLGGGGAERQTVTWLRHLDRTRFQPMLYLVSKRGELASLLPDDVPVVAYEDRHPAPRFYFPGRIFRQHAKDLTAFAGEQQAEVLVTVALHMTLLGSEMSRRPAGWLAVEMADPRQDFSDQVKRFRSIKRRRLAAAFRLAQPVAVSHGVKGGMAAFYGTAYQRIVVLPNFVDLDDLDRRGAEPGSDLAPDRFHIVTVGRLAPQKGQRDLIEALSQLVNERQMNELHLHLLGQGPLQTELEALVRANGLQDHVTFAGFVPNAVAYIRRCGLFCLPSLYEGLPLALLEAMAAGVPAIATDCESGPRELLADGQFGTVVPTRDPTAIANAIRDAVQHPAAAREKALEARRHVERVYSAQVVMSQLERLIEDAAAAGTP